MVLIALGGNLSGKVGNPLETMHWALAEMAKLQIYVISVSSFYRTKAVGQTGQSDYVNAVARISTPLSASNVLKHMKLIEEAAGRNLKTLRTEKIWGPRPLDLDLIDYKNIVSTNFHVCRGYIDVTKRSKTPVCGLVLPHPQAHLRPFVMRPLADILPFWHHPVLGSSALSFCSRLKNSPEGRILQKIF